MRTTSTSIAVFHPDYDERRREEEMDERMELVVKAALWLPVVMMAARLFLG